MSGTAGVRFSPALAVKETVREAIVNIAEDAWTPIEYTAAVWDNEDECWVSDAEIAELPFTAFTSKRKQFHTTARLIVRRVKRLNPKTVPEGQAELFGVWRHHVVFTDSRFTLAQAEPMYREHAVVEQVFTDLEASALGHLPSGKFTANSPRGGAPGLAATAHNLTWAASPRLHRSRQSADRHHPPPPRPRPGPDRGQGPDDHPAPTSTLALGSRLHRPVDDHRTASAHLTQLPDARPRPGRTLGEPAIGTATRQNVLPAPGKITRTPPEIGVQNSRGGSMVSQAG
ncbi:hypothetical protein [Streptomyces incanus]|uniref:Transposase n=1 Tax=Streptomyces incanus TaxID=887453 RepID=A0ABW0XUR5_9ACTN